MRPQFLQAAALFVLMASCGGTVGSSAADAAASGDSGLDAAHGDEASSTDSGGSSLDASGADVSTDACGGRSGNTCLPEFWCSFFEGTCHNPDQLGACRKREALPCVAPMPGDEVCGCDGMTYSSRCTATSAGQSVAFAGACSSTLGKLCGGIAGKMCGASEFCDWGAPPSACGAGDMGGVCKARPTSCTPADGVWCACDGKVYDSPCSANRAGQSVKKNGPC